MALINCPECNQEVSDWAKSCPQCAFPIDEFIKKQAEEQALTEKKEPDSAREEKEEKPERKGTLDLPEGKKYEGEIKNDKPHGQGVLILPDGRKYIGGFKIGKADGYGTLFDKDGKKVREGEWKDGNHIKKEKSMLNVGMIIFTILVPIVGIIAGMVGIIKKKKGAGRLLALGIGVSFLFMLLISNWSTSLEEFYHQFIEESYGLSTSTSEVVTEKEQERRPALPQGYVYYDDIAQVRRGHEQWEVTQHLGTPYFSYVSGWSSLTYYKVKDKSSRGSNFVRIEIDYATGIVAQDPSWVLPHEQDYYILGGYSGVP